MTQGNGQVRLFKAQFGVYWSSVKTNNGTAKTFHGKVTELLTVEALTGSKSVSTSNFVKELWSVSVRIAQISPIFEEGLLSR